MMELKGISTNEKKELLKRYWPSYSSGLNVTEKETQAYFKRVELAPDAMWKEAMESWYYNLDGRRIVRVIRKTRDDAYLSVFLHCCDYGNKLANEGEEESNLQVKFLEHVRKTIDASDEMKESSIAFDGQFNKKELLLLYWLSYSRDCRVGTTTVSDFKGYLKLVRENPDIMWKEAMVSWLVGDDASYIIRMMRGSVYWSAIFHLISSRVDSIDSKWLEPIEPLFKVHVLDAVWQSVTDIKENGVTHVLGRPVSMFSPLPDKIFEDEDIKKIPKINKKVLLSVYFDNYSRCNDVITMDDASRYLALVDQYPDLLWDEAVLSWSEGRTVQDLVRSMREGNDSLSEYLVQSKYTLDGLENKAAVEAKFSMVALNFAAKTIWSAKLKRYSDVIKEYFAERVYVSQPSTSDKVRSLDVVLENYDIAKQVSMEDEKDLNTALVLSKKNLLKLYWQTYSEKCDATLSDAVKYLSCVERTPSKMWKEAVLSFSCGQDAGNLISAMRNEEEDGVGCYLTKCSTAFERIKDVEVVEERFTKHLIDTGVTPVFEAVQRIDENSKKSGKVYQYTNLTNGSGGNFLPNNS